MPITNQKRELILINLGPRSDTDSGFTDADGNHYGTYIRTPWSNLLDAAAHSQKYLVNQLMSEASRQEVQDALTTLENSINLVRQYCDPIRYAIPDEFEAHVEIEEYSSTLDENSLVQIKNLILLHLTNQHYQQGIKLTKQDKRIIETDLLNKVNQCQSMGELHAFLISHEGALNHLRNPELAWIKSQLLHAPIASTLKTKVINAVQSKALFLIKQQNIPLSDDPMLDEIIRFFSGNVQLSQELQQHRQTMER